LDQLANEGLLFTNYFVNSNWTRPSTASILTGLMPSVHGVEGGKIKLSSQIVTLPKLLSKAGIPTGAVIGNGNGGSAFGLDSGFDFYADTVGHWKGLPTGEEVVELAVPFVEKNKNKPFFLMLFLVDPHDPYHAPGEFETMFVQDPTVELIRTPHWELGNYSKPQIQRMLDTYDGAVRYTDTVLGRFFDRLKKLGIYEKSTIIVTADHGEAFGEHGVYLHSHHFYDEIIRVPLIIRRPTMSVRGSYNHYLFESIDLAPSILSLFEQPVPADWTGEDIFGLLKDPTGIDPGRAIISEFNNFGIHRRAIRTYDQKIILQEPANEKEFRATVGRRELLPSVSFDREITYFFDLAADPAEKRALNRIPDTNQRRWRSLLRVLKGHRSIHPPKAPVERLSEIDEETARDLRAMGYIQ
jgi:arylsulfatase A-like enzyme